MKVNDDKTKLVLIGYAKRFAKIHIVYLSIGSIKAKPSP